MLDYLHFKYVSNRIARKLVDAYNAAKHKRYKYFNFDFVEPTQFPLDTKILSYCEYTYDGRLIIGIEPFNFARIDDEAQGYVLAHEVCHAFVIKNLKIDTQNYHGPEWEYCMSVLELPLEYNVFEHLRKK